MGRWKSIIGLRVIGRTVVLALGATGCSAILGLGGAQVGLALSVDASIDYPIRLEVSVAGGTYEVYASQSRTVDLGRSGTLQTLAVILSGPDTLAADALAQTFREDSNNWLHAWVGGRRPFGHCIGSVSAVPLRGHEADSVFVLRGSIPKDAVC